MKISFRRYQDGGGFKSFIQGGGKQAALNTLGILDSLADYTAQKAQDKKQKEELLRQREAKQSRLDMLNGAKAGLNVAQYDRDASSEAISSAQALVGEDWDYPQPDAPTNNQAQYAQEIASGMKTLGTVFSSNKNAEKTPAPVVTQTTANPNDQSTNPAGKNVDSSLAGTIDVNQMQYTAKKKPVLAGSLKKGGLIPRFSIHCFQSGGSVTPVDTKKSKWKKWGGIAQAATEIGGALINRSLDGKTAERKKKLAELGAINDELDSQLNNFTEEKQTTPTSVIDPNNIIDVAQRVNVTPPGFKPIVKSQPKTETPIVHSTQINIDNTSAEETSDTNIDNTSAEDISTTSDTIFDKMSSEDKTALSALLSKYMAEKKQKGGDLHHKFEIKDFHK